METITSLVQDYQEAELVLREAINNEISAAADAAEMQRGYIIASLNSSNSIEAVKASIDDLAKRGEFVGDTCFQLDHAMRMTMRTLRKHLAYL